MKQTGYLLLMLLAFSFLAPGQTAQKSLEGVWQGTLDTGAAKLRLVLTISKAANDSYSGKLESLDQGATIPIDAITVNGDAVRLELKSVAGVFQGELNRDRSELAGKLTQSGTTLPLTFKASDKTAAAQQESKPKPANAQRPLSVPLDVFVPTPPTAFKGGGKTHLVYELHITNFAPIDCLLTQVEVIAPDGKPLAGYKGNELAILLARPGLPQSTEKPRIGGGLRAVAYMWITLEPETKIPASLSHRLTAKVGEYPEELSVDCAKIEVGQNSLTISPPLRGSEWLAANGPSNLSGHRRAAIPIDGQLHIAQRFAIDWLQLREDGRSFTGDQKDNRNYRCYGAEALAVSDAVVADVKDGIPENVPGLTSRAVPITLETIGGNYVILDLGQNRYAFYAHLQPGSLRVKKGDKVRRGQTLGLVGNSGNSTEPHLHFHIGNANSPLGSEGLPYSLGEFEVQGKGWGWKSSDSQSTAENRRSELPLQNEVVRFPSTK